MLKIIKATYGDKDVTSIVKEQVVNNYINITASNLLFGDPKPFTTKYLNVEYEKDGIVYKKLILEEDSFIIGKREDHIPISCLCLTYGRPHLIIEALHSYLLQEYEGESEFLIINDAPFQRYHFEHPNVRIINLDVTFEKWGAKEDFGISQCKYDIVVQFDDDDLAIQPIHLQNINKYFTNGSALLHWHNAAFMNGGKIAALRPVGNSGIVFSKDAWRAVGGYPHENCGADQFFTDNIVTKGLVVKRVVPPDEEVSWSYRWGENDYNLSGLGADWDRPEEEQIIERHIRHIQSLRDSGEMPEGDIILEPSWRFDYTKMLKDFIDEKNN
jgi:hypothetical protein